MEDLFKKKCKPCDGETTPLSEKQAENLLKQLAGWELKNHTSIVKTFKFKNYFHTISFVNALAWIANTENHHPDLRVSYNQCHVEFSTHSIGGLSENDFICAAKIDNLIKNE